jgi:hypothetical protein
VALEKERVALEKEKEEFMKELIKMSPLLQKIMTSPEYEQA